MNRYLFGVCLLLSFGLSSTSALADPPTGRWKEAKNLREEGWTQEHGSSTLRVYTRTDGKVKTRLHVYRSETDRPKGWDPRRFSTTRRLVVHKFTKDDARFFLKKHEESVIQNQVVAIDRRGGQIKVELRGPDPFSRFEKPNFSMNSVSLGRVRLGSWESTHSEYGIGKKGPSLAP